MIFLLICVVTTFEAVFPCKMSTVPQEYWGKKVTLRNKFTKEYLHAHVSYYGLWNERRYVLTKRDKKCVKEKGEWWLETDDNGEMFTFRNVYHSEFLYAAGSNWYKVSGFFGFKPKPSVGFSRGGPSASAGKFNLN